METAQVVALLGFLVVAIVVALGARRTGTILSKTREAEGFRGDVDDLARRVEKSLGEISALIDAVRRRDAEASTIAASLEASRDAVDRYAEEARAMAAPSIAIEHRNAIVYELERAGRALDLVAHGCALLTSGRRIERGTEADISIKRGYLNLIHARESITDHAKIAVLRAEDASPVRKIQRRNA